VSVGTRAGRTAPSSDEPSLIVLEVTAGEYQEVARVAGDDACDATAPFSVRVISADLVR